MNNENTQKQLILGALDKGLDVQVYFKLLHEFASSGKTSGTMLSESRIHYTKLNDHRSRRTYKTIELSEEIEREITGISDNQTWLIISETWCGDAANSIPVFARIADLNPKIDVRVVMRDENPELMNYFLTGGSQSIPKLIALDHEQHVMFTWGPRPDQAQRIYNEWKENEPRPPYDELQIAMQKWYIQDQGLALQQELLRLWRSAAVTN